MKAGISKNGVSPDDLMSKVNDSGNSGAII